MLKKTITYEDFNGVKRTEDFYFNMQKAELHAWENSINGGMNTLLSRIVQTQDVTKLIEYFQELINRSYGQKSDDGRHFRKSPEILADFTSSNAYDVLYMELVSDTNAAIAFVKGIMPPDLAAEVKMPELTGASVETIAPAT